MNTTPSLLTRELLNNERLLWQGRPGQGIRFQPYDVFMVPFSIFWCGFAFFWEASVLGINGINLSATTRFEDILSGVNFFAIWGIPFCLIGLYMVFGRFFFDAWQRSRTTYGVTDQRVLLVKGQDIIALSLTNLPACQLQAGLGGRGTITFGPTSGFDTFTFGRNRYNPPSPAFVAIDDARKVYQLIQDAIQAGRKQD